MILVTTGTQLPFDRLVAAVDDVAPSLTEPVFAQIGVSDYKPRHFEWTEKLRPSQFDEKVREASLVVSHAGIGTILRAKKYGKPIILFPRQVAFGEQRNDHQLATCAQLADEPGIYIAMDPSSLAELMSRKDLQAASVGSSAERRAKLLNNLRDYLRDL